MGVYELLRKFNKLLDRMAKNEKKVLELGLKIEQVALSKKKL